MATKAAPWKHLTFHEGKFGTGDASRAIRDLLEGGIHQLREMEQWDRLFTRGTDLKLNPYVSDVGRCERQIWLSLANEPETNPLETDSLINFALGHAAENWLAEALKVQGGAIVRELRVEIPAASTIISGRADFLIFLRDYNSAVELKSTSSRAMKWLLSSGEPGRPEHRKQLNLYLHALRNGHYKPQDADLPQLECGHLVYCVKDATKGEPPIHAWTVEYDTEQAQSDIARLTEIYDLRVKPDIPEGYTEKKFPCGYCSYQKHCWD